jgi:peptidoglycan/xylan/chitin deacetylase (PgdA/CDA1 family)
MKQFVVVCLLFFWVGYVFGQEKAFHPIPALSYHNVRTYSTQDPAYFITPERLEEHIKRLKEAGYQSVLPSELEAYFYQGENLAEKSVLISFDDTRADHYFAAAPILEKYGFRGTFFIMTVSIGKPGYMTKDQIKDLSDRGHAIGLHTWDHQDLRKIGEDQWKIQIDKPKALLEEITEKTVTSLAYPYGLWNPLVIHEVKARGLLSAFQLGGNLDSCDPVFSLTRILVPGDWSGNRLAIEIKRVYK